VDHEIGALQRIVPLQDRLQDRRAHGRIADHREPEFVRGAADGRHVQHIAVWIAGRFEQHVDSPAALEAPAVFCARRLECA
jgi:hypothetical protein